jgi:hypothetical protein
MNERIRELALQAGFCVANDKIYIPTTSEDITTCQEKFAELLVRECAELVEGFTIEQEVALDQYDEYEASAVLKEHFGVEE